MYFEFRPDGRTLGTLNPAKDVRIIATLKDGKEIRADVAAMPVASFRKYLERLLERDLTDESRERITRALETPFEEEPIVPRKKKRKQT